jgi:inosine-uridine nucleoside N-ribohydrolase
MHCRSILLLALLICAALPMAAHARQKVVVDADMSFDDAASFAYLAQADRQGLIDLDAVTVSLSGAGYTGRGLSHARCLVRKHGLRGVPVADGDLLGANPLPEAIRGYVDRVVHNAAALSNSAGCPDVPTEGRAARVLTAPRGKFTLIALGPLTNIAQALERDPSLAKRIESVYIMGAGTTHGNLCCGAGDGTDHGQEFNFWADPAAAQKVFTALSGKIRLTALNATDFVPITFAFRDRLAASNTTVATATVVTILADPDVQEYMRQGLMYWWDPLNAAAAITGRYVTYERTRLTVVQSGLEAGRTVVDPRGARIDLGVAADARAFENHFLAMLKGRSSRRTADEVDEGGGIGHVRPRRPAAARGVN